MTVMSGISLSKGQCLKCILSFGFVCCGRLQCRNQIISCFTGREPKYLMHLTGARHLAMPPLSLALRNCLNRMHVSVVCQHRPIAHTGGVEEF